LAARGYPRSQCFSEGRAVKELAPATPAPAQNITQQEAYEIAKDAYVYGYTELKLALLDR
jgi:hypothetical protein